MTTLSQAFMPDVDALLRLVGFDETHRQQLAQHGAALAASADGFGQRYFGHLLECAAPTAAILQQLGAPLRHLTEGQQRHHAAMLTEPFDSAAVARAMKMGRVHAKLGVDPAFLCALGEVHLRATLPLLVLLPLDDATQACLQAALRKRVQLDMLLQLKGSQMRATGAPDAPVAAANDALQQLLHRLAAGTSLDFAQLCAHAAGCGFAAACYALPGGQHQSGARTLLADAALRQALDLALDGKPWPVALPEGDLTRVCTPLLRHGQPVGMLVLDTAGVALPADTLPARLRVLGALAGGLLPVASAATEMPARAGAKPVGAELDALTGLPNRSQVLSQIAALPVAARWVIALAIDDFHEINARLGHELGDRVLLACASRLQAVMRQIGGVGRVGAARFVVYADKHRLSAEDALARLMAALGEPVELGREALELRVCAGVADEGRVAEPSAAAQLRCADLALIRARKQGVGGWHYYDSEMDVEIRRQHRTRRDFAQALQSDELALFFQPKINLISHQVTGVEALVRWRKDDGFVPPGRFFPAIENTDLMRKLDAWVLASALRHAAAWHKAGRRLSLSVNLSAQTLNHEQFLPMMQALLAQYPLPAGLFEIEVLETLSQQEAVQIAHKLARCRDWGVRIALDDFGTGASSLVHLQQLPFDTIKIDQRFVRIMIDAPDNEAIIRSMVSYARYSGRRLVAEGIESQAIWQRLLELGCEDGQGYEISPPMSAPTLDTWLGEWQREGVAA